MKIKDDEFIKKVYEMLGEVEEMIKAHESWGALWPDDDCHWCSHVNGPSQDAGPEYWVTLSEVGMQYIVDNWPDTKRFKHTIHHKNCPYFRLLKAHKELKGMLIN